MRNNFISDTILRTNICQYIFSSGASKATPQVLMDPTTPYAYYVKNNISEKKITAENIPMAEKLHFCLEYVLRLFLLFIVELSTGASLFHIYR